MSAAPHRWRSRSGRVRDMDGTGSRGSEFGWGQLSLGVPSWGPMGARDGVQRGGRERSDAAYEGEDMFSTRGRPANFFPQHADGPPDCCPAPVPWSVQHRVPRAAGHTRASRIPGMRNGAANKQPRSGSTILARLMPSTCLVGYLNYCGCRPKGRVREREMNSAPSTRDILMNVNESGREGVFHESE